MTGRSDTRGETPATETPRYLAGYESTYATVPRAAALEWFRDAKKGDGSVPGEDAMTLREVGRRLRASVAT